MKRFSVMALVLVFTVALVSCGSKKQMTPEDFIKIQTDFLSTDLSNESKVKVAEKYGFTADQYTAFEEKVESDIQLKTKVGEIRLKQQK